jgi:hypothetical protein
MNSRMTFESIIIAIQSLLPPSPESRHMNGLR